MKAMLRETHLLLKKVNSAIEQNYNSHVQQALIVYRTDIGIHHTYNVSIDTFPAQSYGILTEEVLCIATNDISSAELIKLLAALYKQWEIPMVFRNYTPSQVAWFKRHFGNRIFNESTELNWW